uniref:Uncharacterized protein n=1 Tax=Arundo donax TaxID=35708 RepID=A0A0A9DEU5_ARUDO
MFIFLDLFSDFSDFLFKCCDILRRFVLSVTFFTLRMTSKCAWMAVSCTACYLSKPEQDMYHFLHNMFVKPSQNLWRK